MRITRKTAAFLLSFFLLFSVPTIGRGEVLISTTGVGAMDSSNQAKAEQAALHDAFSKAALQASLKYVPQSAIPDLVQSLPEYTSSRGSSDIIQYQITSRSQLSGVLLLNVDIRMNDEPLKEWIASRALSTPAALRPRVLLMISEAGPGKRSYEWWTDRNKSTYSNFEAQLAAELKRLGENVIDSPQMSRIPRSDFLKPVDIARSQGADILITGSLTTLTVVNRLSESTLKLTVTDLKTQSPPTSWTISHKSDLPAAAMNALLIDEVIKPVRGQISTRIASAVPVTVKKTLCIEGIGSYDTYKSIVNTLKSMDNVTRLSVTGVTGSSHAICHSLEIRGSLNETMENLKHKQVAEADILVEDDHAVVRLIRD